MCGLAGVDGFTAEDDFVAAYITPLM